MKQLHYFLLAFVFALTMASCTSDKGGDKNDEEEVSDEVVENAHDEDEAGSATLSTWEGQSAKETPGTDGKWVATLAFGEELTLLNETETDAKSGKEYEKVRLLDGKEGWVRADFLAKDAVLAAAVADAQVYKRPGISNLSDDMVLTGTIVVVKGHKDEFSQFIARNDASNKRKEGWILGDKALSTDEQDVAAAVLYNKAMSEKSAEKRKEKLKQVISNYPNSVFATAAQNNLDGADAAANMAEDELMITGDNVNVRSSPTVEEDNKVFQLNSGVVCKILERGDMDEIGGKLDYWYKVNASGQSGWVFGTFTSKAL